MAKRRNFFYEAFFTIPNMVFLAVGATASLLSMNYWVGGSVLGLELAYTLGLSQSRWFRRRVRAKKGWGGGLVTHHERGKLASALSSENAARYSNFRRKYRQICERSESDFSDDALIEATIQKLEGLSDTFLKLLQTEQRTVEFLRRADKDELLQKRANALKEVEAAEGQIKQIKERSVEMIDKRLESIEKGFATLKIIRAQMEMIEQSVEYLHDSVMTMDKITEIGSQVDLMMANIEDADKLIGEMDSLVLSSEPVDDTIPAPLRAKVR